MSRMSTATGLRQIPGEMYGDGCFADPALLIVDHDRFHASGPPSGGNARYRRSPNGGLNHGSMRRRTNAATRNQSRPVTMDRGGELMRVDVVVCGGSRSRTMRRKRQPRIQAECHTGTAINWEGSIEFGRFSLAAQRRPRWLTRRRGGSNHGSTRSMRAPQKLCRPALEVSDQNIVTLIGGSMPGLPNHRCRLSSPSRSAYAELVAR